MQLSSLYWISGRWNFKYVFHVHPENWGRWIHFDVRIFFKWVGSTTNRHYICICFRGLLLLSMSNPHKITICLEYGIIWNNCFFFKWFGSTWFNHPLDSISHIGSMYVLCIYIYIHPHLWYSIYIPTFTIKINHSCRFRCSTSEFGRELWDFSLRRRRWWCQGYLKSCGLVDGRVVLTWLVYKGPLLTYLVGGLRYFLFSTLLGDMIQFD